MIELTKHHGLGNDFLVCDASQLPPETSWPDHGRSWCDRHRGIGADGLLLLQIVDRDELTMVLYNGDGSRAEMSGNGIRCLVQAAYVRQRRAGRVTYMVHTDAGTRFVDVSPIDES